jgi:predicted small metal-binding protein
MAKGLRCSDVGFACDATINADDEDAVMTQAAQHAKDVHGLTDQDLERHGASIRHDPRRLVPRPSRPGRRQRLGAEVTLFKVWRDLPGSGGNVLSRWASGTGAWWCHWLMHTGPNGDHVCGRRRRATRGMK